jgi:dienelactone hydrolase
LSTLAASAALIFEVEKPSGLGLFPGVVLVHHLPGWSEFYIETTRRFAHHGYLAICANLYERAGQGDPDDVAAKVRADGGIADAQVVGDTDAAVKWMRTQTNHNGIFAIAWASQGAGGRALSATALATYFHFLVGGFWAVAASCLTRWQVKEVSGNAAAD